ncbi:hypothetical protein RDI58_027042 [Solanum bulbocastanum]|uniref:Uncharacterized protein n=1 Tax=Solanum bulbocastanum TaxID=147425 RepID=A0AAN8T032_SOLBU
MVDMIMEVLRHMVKRQFPWLKKIR